VDVDSQRTTVTQPLFGVQLLERGFEDHRRRKAANPELYSLDERMSSLELAMVVAAPVVVLFGQCCVVPIDCALLLALPFLVSSSLGGWLNVVVCAHAGRCKRVANRQSLFTLVLLSLSLVQGWVGAAPSRWQLLLAGQSRP
jgi:hypothetical protein